MSEKSLRLSNIIKSAFLPISMTPLSCNPDALAGDKVTVRIALGKEPHKSANTIED